MTLAYIFGLLSGRHRARGSASLLPPLSPRCSRRNPYPELAPVGEVVHTIRRSGGPKGQLRCHRERAIGVQRGIHDEQLLIASHRRPTHPLVEQDLLAVGGEGGRQVGDVV